MQRFERMVTIPEDEYRLLRSMQQIQDPLQTHFQQLTKEYAKQDNIKDPHERVFRKGETLQEMIHTKESLRDRLMEATPRPYQTRADSLYKFMKDKIRFNEKGEIYNNTDVIEGSNIADLVQHAVRDRRRQLTPVGWQTFLTQLKDVNAPRMVMNYDTLEELKTPIAQRKTDKTDQTTNTSPRKRSRAPTRLPLPKKVTSSRDDYLQPELHLRKKSTRRKTSPKHLRDFVKY